jgi:hypothetical protein
MGHTVEQPFQEGAILMFRGVFMKNFGKLIGIFSVVTVIACSMAGCELFELKPDPTSVTRVP